MKNQNGLCYSTKSCVPPSKGTASFRPATNYSPEQDGCLTDCPAHRDTRLLQERTKFVAVELRRKQHHASHEVRISGCQLQRRLGSCPKTGNKYGIKTLSHGRELQAPGDVPAPVANKSNLEVLTKEREIQHIRLARRAIATHGKYSESAWSRTRGVKYC
jgi:hypothetical protein